MAFQSKKANSKPLNMKLVSIMSALLVLSSVGSLVGTYSWYEYTMRAGLNYHGTAVGDSSGMTIGIYSKYVLYDSEQYGLIKDNDRNGLYWAKDNKLSSEALMYYSKMNFYAGNLLQPTTSGSFEDGEIIKLKTAPSHLSNYKSDDYAALERFVHLPLAFKLDSADEKSQALKDERVVLSNVTFEGETTIKNGLRIFFNNGDNDTFIYNPTSNTSGYDYVGGPLDLNLDGYYDFYTDENGVKKEYIYGESDGDVFYEKEPCPASEPLPMKDRNTFDANHFEGVYAVDDKKTTFKQVHYVGNNEVIGKKPLGYIDAQSNVIKVDALVYAEGWSPFISFRGMEEATGYFNLTLDFEQWSA